MLKSVTLMVGLAVLLVNTGDCVNLAFADAKGAECCLKQDCPLAGGDQMDSCCTNPVSAAKYMLGAPHKSLSQPSVKDVEFSSNASNAAQILRIVAESSVYLMGHAPPGGLNSFSSPLLI